MEGVNPKFDGTDHVVLEEGPVAKDKDRAEVRLLTIPDVAEFCRVSERTVRRWIKAGELPAIRLGRQWRIAKKDFERFLSDHRT